jgi:hypothetical protein
LKTTLSALTSAASGVRTNLRTLDRTAGQLAASSVTRAEPGELADVLVAALIEQRALEAAAGALRRIDDAIGSIIDTFA